MVKKSVAELKRERAAKNLAALEKVVAIFGDRSKLGRALKISRATPSTWDEVPQQRVRQLSDLTGMKPEEILPDPFPYP